MSLDQIEKLKASLLLTIYEGDKRGDEAVEELKETKGKLQEQEEELEKKVKAQFQKSQQYSAAAKAKTPLQVVPKLLDLYALDKCKKKKESLQKKIDKVKNDEFEVELQITLREGRSKVEKEPIYDDDLPINKNPAIDDSLEKDMTMNNDELRRTIHESNKHIKVMQLKPLAKFQHKIKKPFISMKNNMCKLFSSAGQNTATTRSTS